MTKGRLEAFSDGVIAIIITIMVLEIHAPEGGTLADLLHLLPVFLSYVLSFIYVAIYWNNHHHMLHASHKVNGRVLWANMHLLFWLSLVPFTTRWMGQNHMDTIPVVFYGGVLFMAALAYYILAHSLTAIKEGNEQLVSSLGKDCKGVVSLVIYAAAIGVAFYNTWASIALYTGVAAMWFIPDSRIEKRVS